MPVAECTSILELGIRAAAAGNRPLAKWHLETAAQRDRGNPVTWLWLAWVADSPEQAASCLEWVKRLEPHHELATLGLQWVRAMRDAARLTVGRDDSAESTFELDQQANVLHDDLWSGITSDWKPASDQHNENDAFSVPGEDVRNDDQIVRNFYSDDVDPIPDSPFPVPHSEFTHECSFKLRLATPEDFDSNQFEIELDRRLDEVERLAAESCCFDQDIETPLPSGEDWSVLRNLADGGDATPDFELLDADDAFPEFTTDDFTGFADDLVAEDAIDDSFDWDGIEAEILGNSEDDLADELNHELACMSCEVERDFAAEPMDATTDFVVTSDVFNEDDLTIGPGDLTVVNEMPDVDCEVDEEGDTVDEIPVASAAPVTGFAWSKYPSDTDEVPVVSITAEATSNANAVADIDEVSASISDDEMRELVCLDDFTEDITLIGTDGGDFDVSASPQVTQLVFFFEEPAVLEEPIVLEDPVVAKTTAAELPSTEPRVLPDSLFESLFDVGNVTTTTSVASTSGVPELMEDGHSCPSALASSSVSSSAFVLSPKGAEFESPVRSTGEAIDENAEPQRGEIRQPLEVPTDINPETTQNSNDDLNTNLNTTCDSNNSTINDSNNASVDTNVDASNETGKSAHPPTVAPTFSFKVLVADDSPTVRKLMASTLRNQSFEVVEACDGVEAVKALGQHKPDLILLDINMPKLDGFQLCCLVKKHVATRHIPVVMLSGKHDAADRSKAQLVGCSAYFTKPFDPEQIVAAIAQQLAKTAVS